MKKRVVRGVLCVMLICGVLLMVFHPFGGLSGVVGFGLAAVGLIALALRALFFRPRTSGEQTMKTQSTVLQIDQTLHGKPWR